MVVLAFVTRQDLRLCLELQAPQLTAQAVGRLLQLAEGDSHEGWTLDSLSSSNATFSRDGSQSTELLLEPAGNGRRR